VTGSVQKAIVRDASSHSETRQSPTDVHDPDPDNVAPSVRSKATLLLLKLLNSRYYFIDAAITPH
jgi:hypothetical protein